MKNRIIIFFRYYTRYTPVIAVQLGDRESDNSHWSSRTDRPPPSPLGGVGGNAATNFGRGSGTCEMSVNTVPYSSLDTRIDPFRW